MGFIKLLTTWALSIICISTWTYLYSSEINLGRDPILFLSPQLSNWLTTKTIKATPRAAARTAILIIAPSDFGQCYVGKRWALGKAMWEQHMYTQPNVDCFFLCTATPRKDRIEAEQIWIEGNTIYVGDSYGLVA